MDEESVFVSHRFSFGWVCVTGGFNAFKSIFSASLIHSECWIKCFCYRKRWMKSFVEKFMSCLFYANETTIRYWESQWICVHEQLYRFQIIFFLYARDTLDIGNIWDKYMNIPVQSSVRVIYLLVFLFHLIFEAHLTVCYLVMTFSPSSQFYVFMIWMAGFMSLC